MSACIAVTTGLQGIRISPMFCVSHFEDAVPHEGRGIAAVASGHDAIEHVDAYLDGP